MIDKNELYDITYALVLIRNDIRGIFNAKILSLIISVLEAENSTEDNQIRKAISSVEGINNERWSFVYHNNVYVNHEVLRNTDIYNLLVKLLQQLKYEIEQECFDKAYDLADTFHCLPEIIADNHFTIPKSFWKTFVKPYRNKWDKEFLLSEQKHLKKYL